MTGKYTQHPDNGHKSDQNM